MYRVGKLYFRMVTPESGFQAGDPAAATFGIREAAVISLPADNVVQVDIIAGE